MPTWNARNPVDDFGNEIDTRHWLAYPVGLLGAFGYAVRRWSAAAAAVI